ncbi:MAG: transposase [Sediminibacterium sp.]|nr:transposase [Sediminibacterium sp.]
MLSIDCTEAVYENKISKMLLDVGQNRTTINAYMKSFIVPNDYVMVDMTNMFSSSSKISYVKEGYNSDMIFDTQFNLMYIYSPKLQQPVFYKLLNGNIREVTGFKNCLKESGIESAIIVADKGFYSKENLIELQKNNFQYIIPLRRDSLLIKYKLLNAQKNEYIEYNNRFIWTNQYRADGHRIFIYNDEKLKVEEQNDYLKRIESKLERYTRDKFNKKIHEFGTMAIATNIEGINNYDAYTTYKSRNEIELMFDGVKNILNADKTYMQNDDKLNGWMFVNHIALQWYYIIFAMLKSENLLSKNSVQDFIKHLYELKKVYINNQWFKEPATKSTHNLFEKLKIYSVK